jgi:hypothetical protein
MFPLFFYPRAFAVENGNSATRPASPLSSRAKPRDLQFYGPFLEMFFLPTNRSKVKAIAHFPVDLARIVVVKATESKTVVQ